MSEADLSPSQSPTPPAPPAEPRLPLVDPSRWLSHEAPALEAVLARLRRRAARMLLAREVLLGAALAVGVLLLGVGLLALKQGWARSAGWGVATLVLIGAAVRGLVLAVRVKHDDVAAARALGSVSPADASDLISAVELARAALDPSSGVSPSLVRAHLSRMGGVASRIDPRPAVRSTPVLVALALLAGGLLLHSAVYFAGGQRARDAYAFLAFRLAAESPTLFAPDPIAGDVTLTYRYPAYMNRPPRTVPGTAGDISAPKGTVVDVNARADRDVERAFAVVVFPGKEPRPTPLELHGRVLTGQILVTEPGEWRFRYAKASGATVAEGPGRPISIEPDAFPEVKITSPEPEIEVDGRESLALAFNASDDYGLTEIDLVWSAGKGAPEQRRPLYTYKDLPRRQRGDSTWSLSSLSLQPGDRVTYRLEAFDNDSVAGRKKGVSASQVLKVFSETEHHHEILKKAQEQWEKLVGGLGDRLEEPGCGPRGEGATKEWAEKTRPKDEMLASVARDMQSLARTLGNDLRAPPEIGRALSHVGSRVGAVVGQTAIARESLMRRQTEMTAQSFRGQLKTEVNEEEKGVLYLEDLMDRRRLLDLAEMSRELQKGREELSKLVDQYKKAPNEQIKQQVLGEVARLKERLSELNKRMQEMARDIQDEHMNDEAQQLMQDGDDMMSQLDRIQEELSKGNSDDALKELEKLQKDIEKMEKQFSEHAGETNEAQKKMSADLQKLASDLLDVQAEQQSVKNATDQARQKTREAAQQKLKQLGAEFVEKQRERVKKAKEEVGGINPELAAQGSDDETMQKVSDRLDQLDKALQSGDFDEALDQAEQAVLYDRDLQMRLSDERDMAVKYPGFSADPQQLDQSAQHADRANKPLRDVAEDLDKVLRKARPPPTDAERQQMSELSKRQGALQRQTESLQQKLDEMGKQMPLFGPGQQKLLQDAAGQMGDAREQLNGTDPRGASARQGEALKKLEALKDAMRQNGEDSGEGGVPMPFAATGEESGDGDGQGQQVKNEKVEIPTADQSKAPDEFRKDILNAMKEEAPERYKQRVRDYYEELVK